MEIKKSYYAVIPATVRYDKTIPAAAKLLYGEITALCNQSGLCWAENTYFANLYEVSVRTVQFWINALLNAGYIHRNIQYAEDGKTVIRRCLSIVSSEFTTPCTNFHEINERNDAGAMQKNSPIILQDNTTTNITRNNPPTPGKKKALFERMTSETDLPERVKASIYKWLEYKKYNYQEMGFKALLTIVQRKVEEYGADAVIELVDECISNTWKGLIWEKLNKRPPQQQPRKPRNYDEED